MLWGKKYKAHLEDLKIGSSALRRKTVLTQWSRVLLKKLIVHQETKIFSAFFFCNPTVHYRVHNRPRLASLLCYMNPAKAIPAYFFKIQFNIILLGIHRVSQRFLSFIFHQNSDHKHRMTRYVVITYVAACNVNFQLRENYECIYGQNVLCDGCNWFRLVYIGGLLVSRILHSLCSGTSRNIILVSQVTFPHIFYNLNYPLFTRHLLLFSCTSCLRNVEERGKKILGVKNSCKPVL